MKFNILATKLYIVAVDPKAKIYCDDVIVRMSNNELDFANDEWNGNLHEDWKKVVAYRQINSVESKALTLNLPLLPKEPKYKVKEAEQFSWDKAKELFVNKLDRQPILENDTDLLMVSCLQEGYIHGFNFSNGLIPKFFIPNVEVNAYDDQNRAIDYAFENGDYTKKELVMFCKNSTSLLVGEYEY